MVNREDSPGAAIAYLALTLLALGRRVDGAALPAAARALGWRVDPRAASAVAHLVEAAAELRPRGDVQTEEVAPAGEGCAPQPAAPPAPEAAPDPDRPLYLYGLVLADGGPPPRCRGLEGAAVQAIAWRDLLVLAHACPPMPRSGADQRQVLAWVGAHESVLEEALERYPALLPFRFNTIVRGEGRPPAEAVRRWLDAEYPSLRGRLERLRGRREYAVVFWLAAAREEADGEAGAAEPASGAEYLRGRKRARERAQAAAAEARGLADGALQALRRVADAAVPEPPAPARDGGDPEVLRCACLVDRERAAAFAAEVDRFAAAHGMVARVTGPLPPYTFADDPGPAAAAGAEADGSGGATADDARRGT